MTRATGFFADSFFAVFAARIGYLRTKHRLAKAFFAVALVPLLDLMFVAPIIIKLKKKKVRCLFICAPTT